MMEKLTFTYKVKEEICENQFSDAEIRSLLAGFAKISGRLNLSQNGDNLYFKTENSKIAKFIFQCLQNRYQVSPHFSYVKNMQLEKSVVFYIIVNQKVQEIIDDLDILDLSGEGLKFLNDDSDISAYFVGAFLASGSVNDPKSSNYHLEISFLDEDDAEQAYELLSKVHFVKFTSRIIKRRNQYVIYIKKSNQIADFLVFIHATNACLNFENVRIYRDYTNNENRLDICQVANTIRTIEAAKKQKQDIIVIDKKMGIDNIPNAKTRLICQIRLHEEEDMTLQDIAKKVSEMLNTNVSKSSINHTFRYLHDLASRLNKEKKTC